MTKNTKRALTILLSLCLCLSVFTIEVSASGYDMVLQKDKKWKSYTHGSGTLYDTGCGPFSLVNAVGYLTGNKMNVVDVADWGKSIGAYNKNGNEGTYREPFFSKAVTKYGQAYGFTGTKGYYSGASDANLQNCILNGGAAIAHVPGHFIALVAFDPNAKTFRVWDSFPTNARGTNPNGDCWKSISELSRGDMKIDCYFCYIEQIHIPRRLHSPLFQIATPILSTACRLEKHLV